MKKVALIGYGAIGRTVMRILEFYPGQKPEVVGVMERPGMTKSTRELLDGAVPVVATLPELLGLKPDLVAECAIGEVVARHGPRCLRPDMTC